MATFCGKCKYVNELNGVRLKTPELNDCAHNQLLKAKGAIPDAEGNYGCHCHLMGKVKTQELIDKQKSG